MIQLDFWSPIKKSDSWCSQVSDSTQKPPTPQPSNKTQHSERKGLVEKENKWRSQRRIFAGVSPRTVAQGVLGRNWFHSLGSTSSPEELIWTEIV